MVSIEVSELKRFLAASRNIKERNIIPILAYVKLEKKGVLVKMTKTNLDSFVVCNVDAEATDNFCILVDEKTLSATVDYAKGKKIEFYVHEDNVVLDDGHKKSRCRYQDPKFFPAIQDTDGVDKIPLGGDFIEALFVAKNHVFVAHEKIRWECFVHVLKAGKKTLVGAANGMILFLKTFKESVPNMTLMPETIAAISGLPCADYSCSDKYDFFFLPGITYGFIKPEMGQPDLSILLDRLKIENPITVSRKELINFCEMVVNMNASSIVPEVSIKGDGDGLLIKFDDASDSQGAQEKITLVKNGHPFPETIFQPKNLITVMKDLGTENVTLSKISGNVVVTCDDKDYKGSIMELAKI